MLKRVRLDRKDIKIVFPEADKEVIKILNFLGCGSAFNPILGNTCAYFEDGQNLFLIDCGETVFLELFKKDMIEKYKDLYILITHMHADHVGSLGSLISYSYFVLGKQVTVIHPHENIQRLLDLMGIDRKAYLFKKCESITIAGIKVNAVSVKHADDMECYGYIIADSAETFYYSGDSYEIPETVLDRFLKGEIDKIFQDTAKTVSSHRSHLPLSELAKIIPENMRGKVFCMHLGCDFSEDIKRMGFKSVKEKS